MTQLNETHDPALRSWVASAHATGTDFPIQNLPLAIFRRRGSTEPLRGGVDAFRRFVDAWYAGGFQKIIFHPNQNPDIRRMICSILAGYAWDRGNPYVAEARRLRVLEELCSG